MPFQIKDFPSIVASQVNHARAVTDKLTDFMPGSVARTIMEAPAVEMEELYLQMFQGLRDAIPVATFRSFGFDKLPAKVARGHVSVSTSPAPTQAIVVPTGTAFTADDGRIYASTEEVVWPAGQNVVRVPVMSTTAGIAGNAAAGVITSSAFFDAIDGEFTIGNSAIDTGRDVEKDDEREARFAEFVRSLSRGTVDAVLYASKQSRVLDADGNMQEYVSRQGYEEVPGQMQVYVYSNAGAPSAELLLDGQRRIDGWRDPVTMVAVSGYRSAGVEVNILAMAERAVTLSIRVAMFPGFALNADVERRLGDIFGSAITSMQPGETLYLNTLVELLLAVPGVRQIVPTTNENIICQVSEALLPGALSTTSL